MARNASIAPKSSLNRNLALGAAVIAVGLAIVLVWRFRSSPFLAAGSGGNF